MHKIPLGKDLDGWLIPDFIPSDVAQIYLQQLSEEVEWRQDQIKLFGRTVTIPRLQAFMGDPGIRYTYSGLPFTAQGWHPLVAQIRAELGNLTGQQFNAVLLNLYRDGLDSMGWHSDDEPELGPAPVIASVSLGAERRFLLRKKTAERQYLKAEYRLTSGSLLWMGPELQQWQHAIPKTKRPVLPRLNLTFRQITVPK